MEQTFVLNPLTPELYHVRERNKYHVVVYKKANKHNPITLPAEEFAIYEKAVEACGKLQRSKGGKLVEKVESLELQLSQAIDAVPEAAQLEISELKAELENLQGRVAELAGAAQALIPE